MKKYAALVVQSSVLVPRGANKKQLRAIALRHQFNFEPRPGYLYVRSRAISSRTNDNYDEFPAEEIKKAYRSFIGKPVFVNHVNDDHKRARGVIIDAALHEDRLADGSPDTWAEVLMEVDAIRFPKLAEAIRKKRIDRTSMGTDVAYSVCSACGNKASSPAEYCQHIPRLKGKKILRRSATGGQPEEHLIREICYGLGFFENSLLVEPPADPTAFFTGVEDYSKGDFVKAASKQAGFAEDWAKVPTDPLDYSMCTSKKDNPTFCNWHKTDHMETDGEPRTDIDGHGKPMSSHTLSIPECDLCDGHHDSLHHYDQPDSHKEDESALDGFPLDDPGDGKDPGPKGGWGLGGPGYRMKTEPWDKRSSLTAFFAGSVTQLPGTKRNDSEPHLHDGDPDEPCKTCGWGSNLYHHSPARVEYWHSDKRQEDEAAEKAEYDRRAKNYSSMDPSTIRKMLSSGGADEYCQHPAHRSDSENIYAPNEKATLATQLGGGGHPVCDEHKDAFNHLPTVGEILARDNMDQRNGLSSEERYENRRAEDRRLKMRVVTKRRRHKGHHHHRFVRNHPMHSRGTGWGGGWGYGWGPGHPGYCCDSNDCQIGGDDGGSVGDGGDGGGAEGSLRTTASNTEPIDLMLQHWDKVNLGLGQNQPHQREQSRAELEALRDQGHTHVQRAGWESGKGHWKPVHPSTGVVPIEKAIGDYAHRSKPQADDHESGIYTSEGRAEIYSPRVKALIDLQNQGFTHARWGRDYDGDEVNKWHGAMPSDQPTKYSSLTQFFAGLGGVPLHQVGDRVIDFRGEQTGTVTHVQDSGNPGKSNKVSVEIDGTENPPKGHPDHLYWQHEGEKHVSTNYEDVWSPHPDAPQEQKDRHERTKQQNKAADDLLSSIEDEHGENFDFLLKHQGALTQFFAAAEEDDELNEPCGGGQCDMYSEPHTWHEHFDKNKANGLDVWGKPLHKPYDGHGAWSCNNYDCTEHPMSMYDQHQQGMPGWMKHDTDPDKDVKREVGKTFHDLGMTEDAHYLLDQQHTGPTKYSAKDQETCSHDYVHNAHGQCTNCGYTEPTEADEECDEPYCKENNFPEGWHTKGEHMDPPHLDPHSDQYQDAEKAVRDAFGGEDHSWLLDSKHQGPSKFSSLIRHFAQALAPRQAEHIEIDPDDFKRLHEHFQEQNDTQKELADHAEKRVVNLNDPTDLKQHMLESHDFEDSDFWRNSHPHDHPALGPAGDDDRPLTHMEVRKIHDHDHEVNAEDYGHGHTMGDSHFHTALRKRAAKEAPTVSGVALKAADTGRILMLQRSNADEKDPARGTWEFPGGHHEDGDATSLHAGIREWEEEVGQPFPTGGHVSHVWRNGPYQGHVVIIPEESAVTLHNGRIRPNPDDPDGDDSEQAAWWDPKHAEANPALRREVKKAPWDELRKAAGKISSLVKTADEDQCPYCSGDSILVNGEYVCEEGHHWRPDDPAAKAYHGQGSGHGIRQPLAAVGDNEAKGLYRHTIKASEIQEGDFTDIGGKTRVSRVHPDMSKSVKIQTKTRGARTPFGHRFEPDAPLMVWRKEAPQ